MEKASPENLFTMSRKVFNAPQDIYFIEYKDDVRVFYIKRKLIKKCLSTYHNRFNVKVGEQLYEYVQFKDSKGILFALKLLFIRKIDGVTIIQDIPMNEMIAVEISKNKRNRYVLENVRRLNVYEQMKINLESPVND